MNQITFSTITILLFCSTIIAQEEIKLFKNVPKNSNEISVDESYSKTEFIINISKPRMYFYPAQKENNSHTAVLICLGGGYSGVSIINEGLNIAKWLNQIGVSAFVLYYRMPNGHTTIPLEDAQMALKIIAKNAKKWNIHKTKIGIMGFSVCGHLASTVGTHFKSKIQRPAFMILGYPVVTMNNELTHKGSRNNLLGINPTDDLVK